MTEKTSNYFNVDSLLDEAENTKYVLHAKGESNEHEPIHVPVLAQQYDDAAEAYGEEFHDSCFSDIYISKMRELNDERIEQMEKLGCYINGLLKELESETDVKEKMVLVDMITVFLIEHTALIKQSFRNPWNRI